MCRTFRDVRIVIFKVSEIRIHSVLSEYGTCPYIYSELRRTNFAAFFSERREKNDFDQKKYDVHYSCKLQCHSLKVSEHRSWNGSLDSHPYSNDDDKAFHIFPSFPAHLVSVLNGLHSHIIITVIFLAFMARFPMLSVCCLHLTRSLQFKYHILTLVLYFQLPNPPNLYLHPSDSVRTTDFIFASYIGKYTQRFFFFA